MGQMGTVTSTYTHYPGERDKLEGLLCSAEGPSLVLVLTWRSDVGKEGD